MKLKDKMKTQKNILGVFLVAVLALFSAEISAQEKDQNDAQDKQRKLLRETKELVSDASLALADDKFVEGEAEYRKAIAINPKSETAKYNLGNAYYNKEKNDEAMSRFEVATAAACSKRLIASSFFSLL